MLDAEQFKEMMQTLKDQGDSQVSVMEKAVKVTVQTELAVMKNTVETMQTTIEKNDDDNSKQHNELFSRANKLNREVGEVKKTAAGIAGIVTLFLGGAIAWINNTLRGAP